MKKGNWVSIHKNIIFVSIWLLILLIYIGIIPVASAATTWYVDDSGGADFTNIQDAVDSASEGDTIIVRDGTYYEHITISKFLTISGQNKDNVMIDGSGSGNCIQISSSNAIINGFTITNGNGYGIRADYSDLDIENVTITGNGAHGIFFVNGKSFTIRNSTIEGNGGGGVIYYNAANGDAIVEDNNIINNVGSGVHIGLTEGKSATIRNNEIENNAGSSSDGIYVHIAGSGGLMTIENNPVKDSGRYGLYLIGVRTGSSVADFSVLGSGSYGICADYSDLNIENVTIIGNGAHGIYFIRGKSFAIRNSTIDGNGGGLIYYNAANGNAIVEDNTIINNIGSGVHIGLAEGKSATIRNNEIDNNAGSSSDGIYVHIAGSGGVVTIENNLVKNSGDDGIYLTRVKDSVIINNNISTNVYGIRLYSSSNNLIFHNNLINNYNAYDTGTNQWDSGTVGNYYSDYTGTDSNGDGIGDTPHPIPGGSNEDRYPLMSPYMTDVKPPFSISNLHSFPSSTWVKWTWTNPSDPDFSYTKIYLNSIHQTNTSSNFFNATPSPPTPNTPSAPAQ